MAQNANYDKLNKYRQKIKQAIITEQSKISHPYLNRQNRQQKKPVDFIIENDSQKDKSNAPNFGTSLSRSNLRKNPSQILKVQQNNQESLDHKYQLKTIQKQHQNSRSQTKLQTTNQNEGMTKRKSSVRQFEKNKEPKTSRAQLTKTHNLSHFQTFSPKDQPILPPLHPPFNQSAPNFTQQQVKILLEQNHILSVHLSQKIEIIKSLQKKLKSVVKSQILHEQKYDVEVSQLTSQNQMIKKSSDQQMKILVQQIKKLNEQIQQKQDEWQNRLNMVRKINLQQSQQIKKSTMMQEQKFRNEIQQLKIKLTTKEIEQKNLHADHQSVLEKLRNQIQTMNNTIEALASQTKMQKSSSKIQHQNTINDLKSQQRQKLELIQLQKIQKQHELNSTIQQLSKKIEKQQSQMSILQHNVCFSQIKEQQQRGKLLIELKQSKQSKQRTNSQQIKKLEELSKIELQLARRNHDINTQQLQHTIQNLQKLLAGREQQLKGLYRQIAQIRQNYQEQIQTKSKHISQLSNKISEITQNNQVEMQLLKIRLSQLNHCNLASLKQLYENKLEQQTALILDKQQLIKSLRDKIYQQIQQININNQENHLQCKQYKICIQQLTRNIEYSKLKQKSGNKVLDTQKDVLKQNILRQQQSHTKQSHILSQTISKLQQIIIKKDIEIQQLQQKLILIRQSNKQQLQQLKQLNQSTLQQKQSNLQKLKSELQYTKKQLNKKQQQFVNDKQYYSNQVKELKSKQQNDYNREIQKVFNQNILLKVKLEQLDLEAKKSCQQFSFYKQLWNQQAILTRLKKQQQQFKQSLIQSFNKNQTKIIQQYESTIKKQYKPRIISLQEQLKEKQQTIQDLKLNYNTLQNKFQSLIEAKDTSNDLNQKVLELGKNSSQIVGNYIKVSFMEKKQ